MSGQELPDLERRRSDVLRMDPGQANQPPAKFLKHQKANIKALMRRDGRDLVRNSTADQDALNILHCPKPVRLVFVVVFEVEVARRKYV